jgi:hypothetical protein
MEFRAESADSGEGMVEDTDMLAWGGDMEVDGILAMPSADEGLALEAVPLELVPLELVPLGVVP